MNIEINNEFWSALELTHKSMSCSKTKRRSKKKTIQRKIRVVTNTHYATGDVILYAVIESLTETEFKQKGGNSR